MILRAAVAVTSETQARALSDALVRAALKEHPELSGGDLELDVALYFDRCEDLLRALPELDLAFFSYEFLEGCLPRLRELYRKNPCCLPVAVGRPEGDLCRYLELRPAGYLAGAEDEARIEALCLACAEEQAASGQVLQIVTRQGSRAVSLSTVTYCRSDQKYVLLVTDSGQVYRKLGKLSELAAQLPKRFVRTHQSFLVNWDRVSGLDRRTWELVLDSGERVPVSRAYKEQIGARC